MIEPIRFNLLVGWTIMVAGAVSGASIGLFFHQENWMGGYASLRRRMIRLGHISFFGLGILNVLFALSLNAIPVTLAYARFGSFGFAIAAVTMPACCFLTAWRPSLRHLFPIPVLAVLCGLGGLIAGWLRL
jgi:multidrug transporter EmrE-like cation transporter